MHLLWVLAGFSAVVASGQLSASRLTVEYLDAPIGLDDPIPRFSFAAISPVRGTTVSAYHIVVRNAAGTIAWDSGVTLGTNTTNIAYAGLPLVADTSYTWTAQWWDANSTASTVATSSFSTGLYSRADWHGALFVGGDNMLRAEFTVATPVARARLFIVGLGYYLSYINNQRTDNHVLGTFTTFEERILYDVWDVTALVHEGCNALGVELGAGWYAQSSVSVGPRSLLAMISVDAPDGTRSYFTSQLNAGIGTLVFTTAHGPVTSDDIYLGEDYDARREQVGWSACSFGNASVWAPATAARDALATAVMAWHAVQIEPVDTYTPVNVTQPQPGIFVVDFGQNMAATVTLRVICPTGSQWIFMRYGESLQPDGTVLNQYGDIMRSNYTCAGTGFLETYTTKFSYYGMRFVQVTNWPGVPTIDNFAAHFVHSAVVQTGEVNFGGGSILDNIQHCTKMASLSNLMDVPTDCPQRERRGWLGDAQLSAETAIYNFDMSAFYTKFLSDIRDSQVFYTPTNNGSLPDCTPFYGHGGLPADPAWSAAYPLITDWLSSYAADDRIVARHYGGVRAFMDSQVRQLEDGVLKFARYGDWCSVANGPATGCDDFKTPDISTAYFIKGLDVTANFATRLGFADDAKYYGDLATTTRANYNTAWFNATSGLYAPGYPINQIMALEIGVAPPTGPTATALVDLITQGTHSGLPNAPTGGIVFTKYAFPVLSAMGRDDLAITLLLAKGMPSYQYWIDGASGVQNAVSATTLWENWCVDEWSHTYHGLRPDFV